MPFFKGGYSGCATMSCMVGVGEGRKAKRRGADAVAAFCTAIYHIIITISDLICPHNLTNVERSATSSRPCSFVPLVPV